MGSDFNFVVFSFLYCLLSFDSLDSYLLNDFYHGDHHFNTLSVLDRSVIVWRTVLRILIKRMKVKSSELPF
uniref:Secreted protein n=1 Tax=Angiostrongylus cantonensis TaxID=6313 RepID=A0A0K0DN49_ANGCA